MSNKIKVYYSGNGTPFVSEEGLRELIKEEGLHMLLGRLVEHSRECQEQRDRLFRAVHTVLDYETVDGTEFSPWWMQELRQEFNSVYDEIPREYRRDVIYPEDEE